MQTIHETRTVPRYILDYYPKNKQADFVQHVVHECVRKLHDVTLRQGQSVLDVFFSADSEADGIHITVTGISHPIPPVWVKGDDADLAEADNALLVQALAPRAFQNDEETV
jgi:hypothetical protein